MNANAPELLEWDSTFFGVRVARIEGRELTTPAARAAVTWCREQRVDCCYLRSDADDIVTQRSAGDEGFRFVDVRMTLDCELAETTTSEAHDGIRTARPADIPELRTIATYNHRNTRFYADEHFARERCDELYATWIEKSVEGWAQRVLVADYGAGAVGYLTLHLKPQAHGEIGLVGVARDSQGRGIGRQLVETAIAWLRQKGLLAASVVTQGRNIGAQRLYQACGFRTRSLELWHHRWFEHS
jgi:dTDP-4-amino-4,6-dideoxy-D-galactose acyltransferase